MTASTIIITVIQSNCTFNVWTVDTTGEIEVFNKIKIFLYNYNNVQIFIVTLLKKTVVLLNNI